MLQTIMRRSIISADVCVLEEQCDHIVVALRIPRKAVDDNKAFLAHLGGAIDTSVKAQKWPWVRSKAKEVVCAGIALTVTLGALLGDWSATASPPPAIEFASDPVLREPYDADRDVLKLQVWQRRNRLCETTFERIVGRTIDGVTIWRERVAGFSAPVTQSFRLHKYEIKMPDLDPGEYTFSALIHTNCGEGKLEHQRIKPIAFTVDH